MPNQTDKYSLPTDTTAALEALVDRIEANPGRMVRVNTLDEEVFGVDMRALMRSLPEGVGEEDVLGILKLALLTECATESYGDAIQRCAQAYDAAWLGRFNARVWVPDEKSHFLPYKKMLLELGLSEWELDREIQETQERTYVHHGGPTPVSMTTFAMMQEFLTDSYHGLIANMLEKTAPRAASVVRQVKRRETLHAVWYRDMTAMQVEANPAFVTEIAQQAHDFEMPSLSLVPELHAQGMRYQQILGANPDQMFRDLFRYIQETLGDVRLMGELVLRIGALEKVGLGPLSANQLHSAVRRLGGRGYGFIGEAALERAGLAYMFKRPSDSNLYGRVRALVRSWVASHMPAPADVALARAP